MQYDLLFAVAKQNLEDAVKQRPDDPAAHFYLAYQLEAAALRCALPTKNNRPSKI